MDYKTYYYYNSSMWSVPQARKKHGLKKFPGMRILPAIVSRTVIFLFFMCLLTIFLYVAGTNQGFIDSTQFAFLNIYLVLGIFLTLSSLLGLFLNLEQFVRFRRLNNITRAGGYIILIIFGSVTVLAAMFIITMSSGNIS